MNNAWRAFADSHYRHDVTNFAGVGLAITFNKNRKLLYLATIGFVLSALGCSTQSTTEIKGGPQGSDSAMFSQSEAYERFMGRWSLKIAPKFLEFAELKDEDSVLDVGSGTGSLAESVLSETQHAQVVGIDPSSEFVDFAQSRNANSRATFETGDGQAMSFQDNAFDKTLSLFVLNFIPDPPKAVDEMIRVTKHGGVVVAAVWDYDEGMEMLRVFWDEAIASDPSIESRDERHMPFCNSDELADLWRKHGLLNVEVKPIVIQMEFESFDDYWAPFLEGVGPAGNYAKSLSSDDQKKLEERIRKRLAAKIERGQFELSGRAWGVKGKVPE